MKFTTCKDRAKFQNQELKIQLYTQFWAEYSPFPMPWASTQPPLTWEEVEGEDKACLELFAGLKSWIFAWSLRSLNLNFRSAWTVCVLRIHDYLLRMDLDDCRKSVLGQIQNYWDLSVYFLLKNILLKKNQKCIKHTLKIKIWNFLPKNLKVGNFIH